jgi:AcrR family transcriptional regulator
MTTTEGTAATSADSPTRVDLLTAARRRFLKGERLDMQALGAELGVSRTTIYRWAGNHDQLLAEVLSGLSQETFHVAERGVRHSGRARILAIYANYLRLLATSEPVRIALRRDPHLFLRVTTRSGPVSRTSTALCEEVLRREVERGALQVPGEIAALASAMVLIGEAALYADLLAGVEPDIDRAVGIVEMLLTSPC